VNRPLAGDAPRFGGGSRTALPGWWPALLLGLSGLVHLAANASWVRLALGRVRHPLELGNVEGMLMDSITRLAHGEPLYGPPSIDFVPLAYMPGYLMAVAPLARAFGPHLWEGRLVALVEALILAGLIAQVVWRETRSAVLALAGPGLLFAGYGFAAGTYDLIQPNSQMLMFAVLGLVILRETRGAVGAAVAGLVMAASFFSKQHGLLFGLMVLPWAFFHDRRRLLPYGIALAIGVLGGFALMTAWFSSWFGFYVYDVPRHWSHLSPVRVLNFVGHDLFGIWGVSSVPALLSLGAAARVNARGDDEASRSLLWWYAWGGGIAAGLLATLDPYAYRHTMMPVVVALALLAPIALQRVLRAVMGPQAPGQTVAALASTLLLLQYAPLAYSTHSYLPLPHAAETRTAFYERLRQVPGRVLIPYHGFYSTEATGHSSAHLLAIDDIARAHGNALLKRDPDYFEKIFAPLRSGPNRPWLLLDRPLEVTGDESRRWWQELVPGYQLVDSLPSSIAIGLRPVAGLRDVPVLLYAPVEPRSATAR
jgi:hypothetical protein